MQSGIFEISLPRPDEEVGVRNENQIVRVEIEMPKHPKPFLGGLRHLESNSIYLHAFSQTDQIRRHHPEKQTRAVASI